MSNIKDVAKLAEVSIGTVSNYINSTRKVSPYTAARIQSAIDVLNFKPNAFARNLKSNTNKEIGVILPNTHDNYYSIILAGIEKELTLSGYYINVALSGDIPENENNILNMYLQKNISGLIIVTCQPDKADYFKENFISRNIPVTFIDRRVQSLDANYLSFDTYNTIKSLVSQLIKNGNRKIGLLVGQKGFSPEDDCVSAYRDCLKQNDIEVDENLIGHTKSSKEDAFRTAISLFQEQTPPVVITTSQSISSGVEQAAHLLGLNADNDVMIISLGQERWSGYYTRVGTINTMRPAYKLGKKAATLLIKNIKSPVLFEKEQIILKDKITDKSLFETAQNSHLRKPNNTSKKLNVLLLSSPNSTAIKTMIFDFTKKTGINVNIDTCKQEYLLETMFKDNKVEKKYDVYMYDIPWKDILISNNVLLNVDEFVNSKDFDKEIFLSDLMDKLGKTGGSYYGVPLFYAPQLLLYRKDLFENQKLREQFQKKYKTPLRPPKSWLEFSAICEFFNQSLNPSSPVQYGTSLACSAMTTLMPEFLPRLWSYGGRVLDENNNVTVNTPSFRKALVNFVNTFETTSPESLSYNIEKTVEEFYMGNTAMLVGFAGYISDANNHLKSRIIGKIGYDHIPGGASILGAWGFGVSSKSSCPTQAFEFISWACGPEMNNYFTILEGQSALREVYENDELINLYPWMPLILKTYNNCKERKSLVFDNKVIPITSIEEIVYKHIKNVVRENADIDHSIKAMQKELEQFIGSF
ncbi:MAG: extracellular solute-binding protein [Clostridia bacterium]|jgi:multiple sugar transport system substrate-binding protein|nr:extracellular solute-binding protein [Clostridia bacterium]